MIAEYPILLRHDRLHLSMPTPAHLKTYPQRERAGVMAFFTIRRAHASARALDLRHRGGGMTRNARIALRDEIIECRCVRGSASRISTGSACREASISKALLLPGLANSPTIWNEPYAPAQGPLATLPAISLTTLKSLPPASSVLDAIAGLRHRQKVCARLADRSSRCCNPPRPRTLRAEHRCICAANSVPNVLVCSLLRSDPRVRLVSLMDHTPGQRQGRLRITALTWGKRVERTEAG